MLCLSTEATKDVDSLMIGKRLSALGLMAVFNEEDILDQCLNYHIDQGLQLLILDNGSTDASLSIARSYLGHGVLGIRQIPTDTYRWGFLLDTLMEWSEHLSPSWCLLVDADTFLEPSQPGKRLLDAIADVEHQGYNTINFDHFEFWPVGDERPELIDVRERLTYYTWADDRQEKAWRSCVGTSNSRLGGHSVDFPAGIIKRVYPENFVLRHYRIRSYDHGLRKVFRERLPRFCGEPPNWHTHYNGFESSRGYFEIPKHLLTQRIEGAPWNREPNFHGWESKRSRPVSNPPSG